MYKHKVRFLDKGAYTIKCAPCFNFCLYNSKGEKYYIRHMPENTNRIKVNIHHPDTFVSNVPFQIVSKGEIKAGATIPLPDAERWRLRPFQIVYNPTLKGTPARIFTEHYPARIEVSPKFYKLPPFCRAFILYHEFGHLFYKTEWKTDQFALRVFIAQGFSPSQAFYALSKVLNKNPQNAHRIINNFLNLQKQGYVK